MFNADALTLTKFLEVTSLIFLDLGTRPLRGETGEGLEPAPSDNEIAGRSECRGNAGAEVATADSKKEPYWDEDVQFTVFRPKAIPPEAWCDLAAAAHLEEKRADAPADEPDPVDKARAKARAILKELPADQIRESTQDSSQAIPQGGQITFVPQMSGIRFNPPQQSFLWEEDEHTVVFRLRADASLDGKVARGRMTVFLGAILVADVPLKINVNRAAADVRKTPEQETVAARPYRKIFASYSHRDLGIVQQFERYAEAIGDEYLRDWKNLRPGDRWNDKLLQMIDEADVFQLFWSHNAMESEYVRREWEYALKRGREGFVRPVYWEDPFPHRAPDLPPPPLAELHFLRIGGGPDEPGSSTTPASGGPLLDEPPDLDAEEDSSSLDNGGGDVLVFDSDEPLDLADEESSPLFDDADADLSLAPDEPLFADADEESLSLDGALEEDFSTCLEPAMAMKSHGLEEEGYQPPRGEWIWILAGMAIGIALLGLAIWFLRS